MAKADPDDIQRGSKSLRPARTALILYGSETGNAQDVAEEVARMAERLRFDTTLLDMDSVSLRDLLTHTTVIFALSTTGQGEMPQNARRFWKTLLSAALRPGILRKVRFSSFGLGDSSYARYNTAHRMLCGRLLQLGAQLFCERGEGNEQHPEGHSAGLREWIVALKQNLIDTFPLPENKEPLPDDEFLEPKWKLSLLDETITHQNGSHTHGSFSSTYVETPDLPSEAILPVRGTHTARLVTNDRITAPTHFQDVRLLDLHLPTSIPYLPGAVAVIYPKNFPSDVDTFLTLMSWHAIADTPLSLHTTATSNHPSPLRHLDLPFPLTLRWLLENVLDIMSVPRRSFFATLAFFCPPDNEDAAYQRDRLLELANPELIDELWDYTTRPKRTILEVMSDFTAVRIPYQYALTALPILKGRQFSIASGGSLRNIPTAKSNTAATRGTRVQLLVAIANPPSPIIKHRRRYGVCTRYIATLCAGQEICLGMQPGYLDVSKEEMENPVILIGPGTGVAPLRAMLWQRLLWGLEAQAVTASTSSPDSPSDTPTNSLSTTLLLFGCRSPRDDDFFRPELTSLSQIHGLQVLTAYSRDKAEPRKYVQQLIRENGKRVREMLVGGAGRVYVCGASGEMPKGVKGALVEVLSGEVQSEGGQEESEEEEMKQVMSKEQAEAYLDGMEKVGRYKQETW